MRILSQPYFRNPKHKKKLGRPTPHAYLHRIAYSMQMRGENEEIPVLLFYGAPFQLLQDACSYIYKIMNGNIGNLLISNEHSCRQRNGKCYWRVAVSVINLNEQVMSLADFTLLLTRKMQDLCNCTVKKYRLETFLNL